MTRARVLMLGVIASVAIIQAAEEDKSQRIEVGVRAPADARAQIDAHVAEWLKESDVPSVAVAYIKDGKVAWTAVYGEQSPGVTATEKTLLGIDEEELRAAARHHAAGRADGAILGRSRHKG